MTRPTPRDVLRRKAFAIPWAGLVVTHVGDAVQVHAQAWLVTDLERGAGALGLVAAAAAVPRLVLGLLAGVLADRYDRRKVLTVTQTLALVQSLVFAALVATGHVTYGAILVLAFLLGVVDTLNLNTRIALLSTLVPREMLPASVALQAMGVNLVQLAGPALAALLLSRAGTVACLLFNAATFLVALVALAMGPREERVTVPRARDRTAARGLLAELREGVSEVRTAGFLLPSIVLAHLLGFFGVAWIRLLGRTLRLLFAVDAGGYGLTVSCVGVGALVASVVFTSRARPESLPRNIRWFAALFAASVGLGALVPSRNWFALALVLLGMFQMAFRSAVSTAIQVGVSDGAKGRAVSLLAVDFSLWSLGAFVLGSVQDLAAHLLVHRAALPLPRAEVLAARLTVASSSVVCLACVAVLAPRIRPRAPATAAGST